MRWINKDGLTCLQFPVLVNQPGIFHGIFLRQSMDNRGLRNEFNVGLAHGTPAVEVWQNRERMLAFFGPRYAGIYTHQVHGKEVALIQRRPAQGIRAANRPLQLNGDALVTDVEGLALVIQVADCQAILVVDPKKGVVANIHSGWRGSIRNIIGTTIRQMVVEFECQPQNLVCGVGPSLGPCCAEFINYQKEIPVSLWKYCGPEYRFDFWQMSVDQLTAAGVRPENISVAGICTKCNQHLFFSYRGERNTGRFAAVIGRQ